MRDNEYYVGDLIEYNGLNDTLTSYERKSGFILKINKDGSFIVGNMFVDVDEIVSAMMNMKHRLNNITLVDRSELLSNPGRQW